jgi:glycosyltransferase involved in cell wall biosynthesis
MSEGPQPLVTVVLPFRDAEATLAAAIRSILLQTDRRWTLALVDDGSSDGSLAIARRFVSERVSLHSDGAQLGISRRLNAAISEVATPYTARMDADDIAFPNRLAVQLRLIESEPALDLVASPVLVFQTSGSLAGTIRTLRKHEEICATPWRGFLFPHPTWLGKTSWFRNHTYDERDDGAEDQALLYRAHAASRFATTADVLLAYREDGRSFARQLHRRSRFWGAVVRDGTARGAWSDALMVSMLQPARIVGDALNIALGVKAARHRLEPVGDQLRADWEELRASTSHSSEPPGHPRVDGPEPFL